MSPTPRRVCFCCLLVSLWLALPAPAPAATAAAEELLRFVPADTTFCLVVRDLRGHAAALANSPLAEAVRRSPLAMMVRAAPELKDIGKADRFLEKVLRLTWEQLRDDILGDAIVFAYRGGPPGKPEAEEGMFLVRARDPKQLAALVERLNAFQKESGDLKTLEERTHDGVKYFRRVEGKGQNFYCLRGPVLIFSEQEALLKQALTQEGKGQAGQESALGRQLRLLGADRTLAALLLNPRAFDAALEAKLARARGSEEAFLKTFLSCWKALEGIALTLGLGAELELGIAVRARPEALPAAVRRFVEEAALRSDLWNRFPDNALLALGMRSSGTALVELLAAFQTKAAFETLQEELNRGPGAALEGKDVVAEVLPSIGPDWGLCVTAPPREDKRWFPAVVFALRVGPGGNKAAPVDRAVINALRSYALFAVIGHNKTRKDVLSLKRLSEDRREIHYLSSSRGQASGLQPSFGLCDGYLVLASSPETFRRFATVNAAPASTGEVPLLRLSVKDLRHYLADRRGPLTAALAEQHRLAPEEVARRLDGLLAALRYFDRVEVVQKTAAGQATLTLRLRTSLPLRK